MKTYSVCRLGALLALVATTVAAQTNVTDWNTVKALTTGTEVRITAGSRTVSGKIDRIADDTLVVTSGKGPEMFTQQEVTRVSVRKKGHRVRHALIGAGIGAGGGAVLGEGAAGLFGHVGETVGWGAGAGAVLGALLGAVIPQAAGRRSTRNSSERSVPGEALDPSIRQWW